MIANRVANAGPPTFVAARPRPRPVLRVIPGCQQTGPHHDPVAGLLSAVAAGDERAFRDLYALIAPRLRAHAARRVADEVAAEEVAQDTLLEVWNAARRYDGRTTGEAWIIARAERHIQSACRPAPIETTPIPEALAAPDPIAAGEIAEAVRAVVATLPREERQAIQRCHLDGLTIADAALAAGRSVATVKLHLSRARPRLRARLAKLRG